jgi:L-alanine-DL-glutamate epimerase-like enolase superfamily enzyme
MHTAVTCESWPLKRPFSIARLTITEATTLHVRLTHGEVAGQGESEPHEYDVAVQARLEQEVRNASPQFSLDMSWQRLRELLPQPTARNPVDCAL